MSYRSTCLAFATAAVLAAPAAAAVVTPTSYSMPLPADGVFPYQDDTYTGMLNAGFLSGGTGELTDGVIAAARWNATPEPWVGWRNIDPTINFFFAPGTIINTIDFYFDDSPGTGGVVRPLGVDLSYGGGTVINPLPTITTNGIAARFSYDIGTLPITNLSATLRRGGEWTMLTEVSFNGSNPDAGAVPEPASWAMLIIGFGMVGTMRRRAAARAINA